MQADDESAHLRAVLDNQPWGTISLDAAGVVLAASERAVLLLQRPLHKGTVLSEALSELVSPAVAIEREALLAGVEVEVNDTTVWLKGQALPDAQGAPGGTELVVSVIDITPLASALDERTTSLRFLLHDLRSPLSSIVALTQLVDNDPAAFEHCGGMQQISRLARYVLSLGEQFIFSSVKSDVQRRDFKRFDLRSTVRQMIPQLEVAAVYCSVSLQLWLPDGPAIWIDGMRNFAARAFQNIVDNAIHASRAGQIVEVSLKVVEGFAVIRISDWAGGLPGLREAGILADFENLSKKASSGFGMGLQLAKQIVELHGGSLHAELNEEVGTTFVMRLPRLGASGARGKAISLVDAERMLGRSTE